MITENTIKKVVLQFYLEARYMAKIYLMIENPQIHCQNCFP